MVLPYYQDALVTLYHGDAIELVDTWTSADVMICDPPYGMSYVSHQAKKTRSLAIAGDESTAVRDRVLKAWGNKHAAVFGTWRCQRPSDYRNLVVWDKSDGTGPGMGDLGAIFGSSHEEIYIFGRWLREGRKRRPSVIRTAVGMSSLARKVGHPTPKPVELMEDIIEASPPGVICDPFAGSGSTLLAARNLGRRIVGVELDERYCEIAALRLAGADVSG